jgi:uncharacterized protein YkwD
MIFLIFGLAACVPASPAPMATEPIATPFPPTLAPVATATAIPSVAPVPTPTDQAQCVDSALFLADVTIADNTRLKQGESFTKTWQLQNTGTCTWNSRYVLAFLSGDRLNSPDSLLLVETAPGKNLDISVVLSAPARDGVFTGLYELRNPAGQVIPIGQMKSVWVKIMVGTAVVAQPPVETTPGVEVTVTPGGACHPGQDGGVGAQILELVNQVRAENKLRALSLNDQLTSAAQGHSDDMACNNFTGHNGSDGSSIHERVVAAGYAPSYSEEIIYAGGGAQDAFSWWLNDKTHRDAILNRNAVHIGVGYSYLAGSAYGSYITVDFASP